MTSPGPRVAIATCSEKPKLTLSDLLLAQELRAAGADVTSLIWDKQLLVPQFDVVVLRSVWDYHLKPAMFLRWLKHLRENRVRVFNTEEVVLWNIDKSYLFELKDRGIAIVPTLLIKTDDLKLSRLDLLSEQNWPTVIVKPTISAGARMTYRCAANDPELHSLIRSIHRESDAMIQPYRESIEYDGEISLIFFHDLKSEYSHSVLKKARAGDFRVQSDFGGTLTPFDSSAAIVEFARSVLELVPKDWLYARVDIIGGGGVGSSMGSGLSGPEISEIELIEPDLYFNHDPIAARKMARAILRRLETS